MKPIIAVDLSRVTGGAIQDDIQQAADGAAATPDAVALAEVAPPVIPVIVAGGGGYLIGDAIENQTGIGSAIGDWVGTHLGNLGICW
jgi:hypothetical protein